MLPGLPFLDSQQTDFLPTFTQPELLMADTQSSAVSFATCNGHSESPPVASSISVPSETRKKARRSSTCTDNGLDTVALKRERNTLAARKHRQKRLDRISDLEKALRSMTQERDELRLHLAGQEAENRALREVISNTKKD